MNIKLDLWLSKQTDDVITDFYLFEILSWTVRRNWWCNQFSWTWRWLVKEIRGVKLSGIQVMPRGITWQRSGHFQITRIIGLRPLWSSKFERTMTSVWRTFCWFRTKISSWIKTWRIIFKPHSEVVLVSWSSLFKNSPF